MLHITLLLSWFTFEYLHMHHLAPGTLSVLRLQQTGLGTIRQHLRGTKQTYANIEP